jgi:hypothetical protein
LNKFISPPAFSLSAMQWSATDSTHNMKFTRLFLHSTSLGFLGYNSLQSCRLPGKWESYYNMYEVGP